MERQNERRRLEDCQKDLAFLGYVPGCIRAYVVTFKCDLSVYKILYETSSREILQEDAAHYSVYSDGDELYCKILAILSSGNSVPLHPFHLAPALLPWTFLKHERRDDGDHVSAVSPLVQDICADYICSDTDHLVKRIEAMLQITGGELGNLGGRLFEQIIHARLRAIRSITYFYYDNENTCIRSQELHLAAIKNFQCSNKRDVSGIRISGTASITHCPNAKHLDFLLVVKDEEGEKTHGIQVTLETRKRKCSISDFFEKGDANYIYLLTPQLVHVESLETETTRDNALRRAFREKHLRIIDPSTVLTSEQMELNTKRHPAFFFFDLEAAQSCADADIVEIAIACDPRVNTEAQFKDFVKTEQELSSFEGHALDKLRDQPMVGEVVKKTDPDKEQSQSLKEPDVITAAAKGSTWSVSFFGTGETAVMHSKHFQPYNSSSDFPQKKKIIPEGLGRN